MKTTSLNLSKEELKQSFYQLETRKDIADLLQVSDYQLRYHLYINPKNKAYTQFKIPKKSGGHRTITAPQTSLKIIQYKLNQVFKSIYKPKFSTLGFATGKSILTNAQQHLKQGYILNLDIKDFFPSINFGRVRGLLMAKPYDCTQEFATVLAQICCYNNELPQGSPCSPIISNMICARLDSQLQHLAIKNRCIYTRYADDITFSTSRSKFPQSLAYFSSESNNFIIGGSAKQIIEDNGFKINLSKVRLQSKYGHQEVTGITVNEKLNIDRKYIRNIRAILHAWKKYGLENTQQHFWQHYNKKQDRYKNKDSFKTIIRSRIEFVGLVKGKDDPIYLKLLKSLADISPKLVDKSKIDFSLLNRSASELNNSNIVTATIWTEGKTDTKHLESAFKVLNETKNYRFKLEFKKDLDDQKQGSSELLKMCEQYSKVKQDTPIIAIFDRDEPNYIKKVHDDSIGFKDWKNNVFSFALPIPSHREDVKEICIEHYYTDEEIRTKDSNGRRLFLSNEFNLRSGRHNEEELVTDKNKIRSNQAKIIDSDVYDNDHNNVALTKSDFANYIHQSQEAFANFSFTAFDDAFQIISKILNHYSADI